MSQHLKGYGEDPCTGDFYPVAGNCVAATCPDHEYEDQLDERVLDWVIVGGESGPGARPTHPDWARHIRDDCQAAGVPFFYKQWGAWAPIPKLPGGAGCMVRAGDLVVTQDGRTASVLPDLSCELEGQGVAMRELGKQAAGSLLDGREWREFPEERHA